MQNRLVLVASPCEGDIYFIPARVLRDRTGDDDTKVWVQYVFAHDPKFTVERLHEINNGQLTQSIDCVIADWKTLVPIKMITPEFSGISYNKIDSEKALFNCLGISLNGNRTIPFGNFKRVICKQLKVGKMLSLLNTESRDLDEFVFETTPIEGLQVGYE